MDYLGGSRPIGADSGGNLAGEQYSYSGLYVAWSPMSNSLAAVAS